MEKIKCLIIGSGPAGYTAAIYASRADLKPVMYTGIQVGGQLTTTTEVGNFPGYPNGVQGADMMEDLKNQAESFDTDIRFGEVTSVDFATKKGSFHKLIIDNTKEIESQTVIIATGAAAKYLGLESEERLKGEGVSACAICDGFFYKNQDVIVVGGGDTAIEEATYLSNICNKVTMLVRKDHMRASKTMIHRIAKTKNISVLYNTEIDEILGNEIVESVSVINNQTQEKYNIEVQGVFIAVGHKPNTEIFGDQLEKDQNGYLITEGKTTRTNKPGVFASGDVQDHHYRQAITAAGTGCMAALDAERYLGNLY